MKSIIKKCTTVVLALAALHTQAQNTFPAAGNVGIGTSSPSQILTVAGGNVLLATPNLGLIFYGGGEKIIGTVDYGIEFQTASGTPRMKIFNNGNIQLKTPNLGFSFYGGGEKIIGTADYGIEFQTANGTPRMKIHNSGAISIGSVASTAAGYKLFVETGILTEKVKVAVKTSGDWSDYVFDEHYSPTPIYELEEFIKTHKHLPGIPSAKEMVQEGNDLGKTDALLLAKIEELALYIIELKKENKNLYLMISELNKKTSR